MIEDMDGIMKEMSENSRESREAGFNHDELIQIQEVREKFGTSVLNHWKAWTDIPLPALGNERPRNAAKNNDGKEAVEALLYNAITSSPDSLMQEMNEKGVKHVCLELGLDFPK